MGWLTYDLTGSAFLLGAVNGFRALPLLVLGPFGGVAADRVDRKRLMLATQAGLFLVSFGFANLVVSGHVRVWHLFVFTMLTGLGWSFNMPVRQSVVPNLVPPEDLMNAVALNSAGFNATRIFGPMVGGILIAQFGAGQNFYIQAAAYLGVALMVLPIRIPAAPRAASTSVLANLKEGAAFVWRHPTLRTQMSLALVPVVIALPYITLMPVVAEDVLHRGAGGLGLLMAAPGVGAVAGTLLIASLGDVHYKGRLLFACVFAMGTLLVLFSFSHVLVLSLGLLVLIGAVQMGYMTTNMTLIQLAAPDELRGRVLGVYMLNQGLLPLGSLLAGTIAAAFGVMNAILSMGVAVALLALAFASRARSLHGL